MPTYGYRCTVCGHTFERFQKITDPAVTECESCGQPVKKILYPVGIQFKGSGFYVNDYSKSGGKSASNSGEDGAAAPKTEGGSPDSKTESTTVPTPAPTSDTKPTTPSTPNAS